MKLDFDIENVAVTEFGVGRDSRGERDFVVVPGDADVQVALHEMVVATWEAMQKGTGVPARYEPSEKYGSIEYLHLPLTDALTATLRDLHEAANLESDSRALTDPTTVFSYFARLTDQGGKRLTALRRASQFKGVLKSRLIRIVTDSLKLIADKVFKLDTDFDLLIDSTVVHILRPSGFEYAGKLQDAILEAVPRNIEVLQQDLSFVDLSSIREYASTRPRAARYLASIQSQKKTEDVDKAALKELCERTGVEIMEQQGIITVTAGHQMGFLEVLDRRRYEVELVIGQPERFKAASRRKI